MSAGESSKRSNLIDVSYQQLHSLLSGRLEGLTLEQLEDIVKPRVEQLRNVEQPFGKPSDASKKKVDSGSVVLRDGVIIRVEEADKAFIFALSAAFDIDQVEALVLLRSFLYNEGLPKSVDSATNIVDELVDAITPFYYSERLFVLRAFIPLFRANENAADPVHAVARKMLPAILPDGKVFAKTLLGEYVRKTSAAPPSRVGPDDARQIAAWAKQNVREQLGALEALFWTMWSYVPCDPALVVAIYEAAYSTQLGSVQKNSMWLLDSEATQVQQDVAALWILITIEVLELERAAEPAGIVLADDSADTEIYWASPDALERIHELVTSHGDSLYACTYMAWTFVLSRITKAMVEMKEKLPAAYMNFAQPLCSGRERMHTIMARTCLDPDAGLFKLMLTMLTNSPLFVTAMAWRTGSTLTDPNAVAYRSVLKGLVIAIVELMPVELVPGFDEFVDVWIALFGRSESLSVSGICRQFWLADWTQGIARRAILDVARSRFPVQPRPLVRLLRAMTATGFLDTDPLSTADHANEGELLDPDRELCARHVFYFMDALPTYTQVVPLSACTGAHALYEKLPDRYGGTPTSPGLAYVNLRPLKLPGGSVLPLKTIGRLLSGDGGEFIVVAWQHEHCGWKTLLEILTDYVNRRRAQSGAGAGYQDLSFAPRSSAHQPLVLRLEDIGVEMDRVGDEDLIMDVLDLIRSVVQDNPRLAELLLRSLETGAPVVSHTMVEAQPPDLVQLTTTILEDALLRSSGSKSAPRSPLITSAMSVLSALLALPKYSTRVWLYVRSTSSLFGSDRDVGVASAVLAAERLTGHYTMTLALLYLVQQLFSEASASVLFVAKESPKLQQIKEEVLLRAARFVHAEVWVEHMGWKYAQLGDRFEIGRRVTAFYAEVFKHSPPVLKNAPFSALSSAIADAFVFKATTSTVTPLVSSLTTAGQVLGMLYASRRYGDARRLIYLLESHLFFTRTLLYFKQNSAFAAEPCLLEQALCTRVGGSIASFDGGPSKVDPVDALAGYVKERGMGSIVPVEAMKVLFSLCSSLSLSQGASPTIIGHLSDPEATVLSLVRIIQHPYDDALLRNAVWNFITLAIDKEPALARLFVTGQFRAPNSKSAADSVDVTGKGKEREKPETHNIPQTISAVSIACDMLEHWQQLWELNPQLLASLLRFLDVVWQHGHEHKAVLDKIRESSEFFTQLAEIAARELGPHPDYRTERLVEMDGLQRSHLHEAVSSHAYRTALKSHAMHIIAVDIQMHWLVHGNKPSDKPKSYTAIESVLKDEDQLTELTYEAVASTYDPTVHDDFAELANKNFPSLKMEQMQLQEPLVDREYGDHFAFSTTLLQFRLQPFNLADGVLLEAVKRLTSINLTLSLTQAQTALTESWQYLLLQAVTYLRGDAPVRTTLLSLAASISRDLSMEKRSGDLMSTIHWARLSLLLALLEVAWFSTSDTKEEVEHFVSLVDHVRGIILSPSHPPAMSFLGQLTIPFHRPLLQIIYFCARHSRSLALREKALNSQQRLRMVAMLESTLTFVIDSLRLAFDSARARLDVDLDQDLELLVAVFEQCTRSELTVPSTLWLTRCQETDVVGASLQLLSNMDLVGLSDIGLLRARKQPLYASHVLAFHMALARIPSAAERLASEGVLTAYSENRISAAIRAGMVDVTLPELPGERSPAHTAYCSMLAVVAGVITSLGRHGQYFDAEACGLIQLFGEQIHRALSWTIGDPLTLPLLEEIEQVVNLFSALAQNTAGAGASEAVERVLGSFVSDAQLLLQQLNYALTHPNHLASLFESVTADEKARFEADRGNASVNSPAEALNPLTRPFLARLVYRLFRLAGGVLSALVAISGAETVLTGEREDWPIHGVLIVPHSKVILGDPASLGTLVELGNCALDVLRHLVDRPGAQALTSAAGAPSGGKALDVRDAALATRRALEGAVLYGVTQLALWLAKPEFDLPPRPAGEQEVEDVPMQMLMDASLSSSLGSEAKERRARRRSSLTLEERLRRVMTGEMAAEVLALLGKAKGVIAKSVGVVGSEDVDLTDVLIRFVHERIAAPP
ncbi:hypothetical protein BKA93DRAFT_823522 [Sparassis latifolia]